MYNYNYKILMVIIIVHAICKKCPCVVNLIYVTVIRITSMWEACVLQSTLYVTYLHTWYLTAIIIIVTIIYPWPRQKRLSMYDIICNLFLFSVLYSPMDVANTQFKLKSVNFHFSSSIYIYMAGSIFRVCPRASGHVEAMYALFCKNIS